MQRKMFRFHQQSAFLQVGDTRYAYNRVNWDQGNDDLGDADVLYDQPLANGPMFRFTRRMAYLVLDDIRYTYERSADDDEAVVDAVERSIPESEEGKQK